MLLRLVVPLQLLQEEAVVVVAHNKYGTRLTFKPQIMKTNSRQYWDTRVSIARVELQRLPVRPPVEEAVVIFGVVVPLQFLQEGGVVVVTHAYR